MRGLAEPNKLYSYQRYRKIRASHFQIRKPVYLWYQCNTWRLRRNYSSEQWPQWSLLNRYFLEEQAHCTTIVHTTLVENDRSEERKQTAPVSSATPAAAHPRLVLDHWRVKRKSKKEMWRVQSDNWINRVPIRGRTRFHYWKKSRSLSWDWVVKKKN